MSNSVRKGQEICWAWGAHRAHGHVVERFERKVQRTIKGSLIVRIRTIDNLAYLVKTYDGETALKRGSELRGI